MPAFNPESRFVQSRVRVLILLRSGSVHMPVACIFRFCPHRWYAVRLSVQPCEPSDCLRIISNAQHTGKCRLHQTDKIDGLAPDCSRLSYSGTGRLDCKEAEPCPQLRYESQRDGLRSELFLVRFIQQQVSQSERDHLCYAQANCIVTWTYAYGFSCRSASNTLYH